MMKNKGFTLIELLGTIIILSAILLVIIPGVVGSIKKSEKEADDSTKNSIILAAQNWVSDNKYVFDNAECDSITVKDLQEYGYLDENVKLPFDGSDIDHSCVLICMKRGNKTKYTYTYPSRCPR
ncbi:MAG: type II secretion system protein [Bacilli bacterium]|nr:type II secretion system protein [Bacilli bacterium]